MRKYSSVGLVFALAGLAACGDSTGNGGRVLRYSGVLDGDGNASVVLEPAAGNVSSLPSLTCYVRNQNAVDPDDRVWFAVSSSIADGTNCILEPVGNDRLAAVLEGEQPGAQYQFVVVY